MKSLHKILLTTLVLAGLAGAGCVGGVAVDGGGGGYYNRGGWYNDGPWIGGGPRGIVNVDVHAGRDRGDFHGGGDHRR